MTYNQAALLALGNATRLELIALLADQPRSVADLTRVLPISQPAVSQHLSVLREAGLVAGRARGASTIYQIDPAGLGAVRLWIDEMWGSALQSFKAHAERELSDEEGE